MQHILNFIRENPTLSPSEVRDRFHITRRQFRRQVGTSVHELLKDAWLERAKEMLLRDELCQFVAKRLGYTRQGFQHTFRRRVGVSPRRWKLMHIKQEEN